MEGGLIAIKQIFEQGRHSQRERERQLLLLQPKTTHTCFLPIHKQAYVNTSSACIQTHHWCQLDLPLSLCSSRLWSSSFIPPFFSHHLVSAEKPRAIYLPHCFSVCAYIQTSAAYFSHHLLQCFSCKASNHLQLYNTLLSFKKTSLRK